MRPALTWGVAASCLLLLTGAMAWATWSLVGMEGTRQRMEADAVVQDRMRLALWRMESVAAALVLEESARDPAQYAVPAEGNTALPAPAGQEDRVWLHFEMDAGGRIHSPQVPAERDRPEVPDEPARRLRELRVRLAEKAVPEQWATLGLDGFRGTRGEPDNRAWLSMANMETAVPEAESDSNAPALSGGAFREETAAGETKQDDGPGDWKAAKIAADFSRPPGRNQTWDVNQNNSPVRLPSSLKPGEAQEEQDLYNKKEAEMRQQLIAGNYARRRGQAADNQERSSETTTATQESPEPRRKDNTEVAMKKSVEPAEPGDEKLETLASRATGVAAEAPESPAIAAATAPMTASAFQKSQPDETGQPATPESGTADAETNLTRRAADPAPAPADSIAMQASQLSRSAVPDEPPAISLRGLTADSPSPGIPPPPPEAKPEPETFASRSGLDAGVAADAQLAAPAAPSALTRSPSPLPDSASPVPPGAITAMAGGTGAKQEALQYFDMNPPASPPAVTVSDFRALWIKDALFLTRRVTRDGAVSIQGAWVNWPRFRTHLLATVADLFPGASLEPAPARSGGGTDLLASLPVRFVPGQLPLPVPAFWSPLKLSLATAWACVLLATAAVILVLRGMMLLSERRASFVSAVTHELRTPLATFKLYSEMLADGMIREEVKRQRYLETLSTEADRLGHLVENVLSYSRLESGKAPGGRTPVEVSSLLQRIGPRLNQRVEQAGGEWHISSESLPDSLPLVTDPAAVEQILFNLVDNACKYARRDGAAPRVTLEVQTGKNRVCFAVRDYGPGISRAESKKLFRAFHKSARDAAHTAPGVGLGLALCRRLARDLGGTLEPDHSWPHGACFVLRLPCEF